MRKLFMQIWGKFENKFRKNVSKINFAITYHLFSHFVQSFFIGISGEKSTIPNYSTPPSPIRVPSRLWTHLRASTALFGKKWYYGTNLQAIGFLVIVWIRFEQLGVYSKSVTKTLYGKFLVSESIFKLVCHWESCS